MRGSLRRRPEKGDDYWELEVSAGRDPVTGRRKRVTRSFRGSKRDAEKWATAVVAEVDKGRGTGTTATLDDLLHRWLELAELSPTTRARYEGLIRLHIAPALGTTSLRRLNASQLDALYRGLLDNGLASATVRQVHAVIRRAFAQGVRWGWLPTNTAAQATPPKANPGRTRPPSPDEAARLIAAAYTFSRWHNQVDPSLGPFLHVAATTGARRGELCALRWCDIDLDVPELTISRALILDHGRLVVKTTKTHAERRVALDPGTVAVLSMHLDRMESRGKQNAADLVPLSYVWTDDLDGARPWRPDRVSQAFRKLCVREGVTGVRLHDLRHFVGTQLIAAGEDVRTVAGRLGHAKASTTLDIYSHAVAARDRSAADVMGRLLGDSTSG